MKLVLTIISIAFFLTTNAFSNSSPQIQAGASQLTKQQIVKINSFSCINQKNEKVGSGMLFRFDNSTYVITSDHVVFHGNRDYGACHTVQIGNKSFNATFISANIFIGLALLKLEFNSSEMPTLSKIKSQIEHGRNEVFATLSGFPFNSKSIVNDNNAQILNYSSERKILPLIDRVIEVKGHSEYGMSGGALLTNDGKFLGLLSHQYLRLQLGRPTRLIPYSEGSNDGELIALAIPAKDVVTWIEATLQGDSRADIRYDIISQIKRQDAVVFDGVRFTSLPCRMKDLIVAKAKGGDGAGIGGNEYNDSDICRISVQLNRADYAKNNQWPYPNLVWFGQLKEKLLAGANAQINGLFFNGSRHEIVSLLFIFTQFQRGAMPLMQIDTPFMESSLVTDKILKIYVGYDSLIKNIRQKSTTTDPDLNDFLAQIESFFGIIELNQWDTLTQLDIQRLIDSPLWPNAIQTDFNSAVSLRSKLMRIRDEIKNIRL